MVTIAQIYDWFMTGKKPTQAQFWASWGSFWNKLEQIPQSAIAGLTAVLNAKAEKVQFDAHKTAEDAHQALFELKQSLTDKGAQGGYAPLDEFTKLAAEYLNIVNDFVTGGSEALASAETVKILKGQIDAINFLLSSDNVNLDNVQKIVDAIEGLQAFAGENIANKDLSNLSARVFTQGNEFTWNTAGFKYYLKNLVDKTGNSNYSKVAVIHPTTGETVTRDFADPTATTLAVQNANAAQKTAMRTALLGSAVPASPVINYAFPLFIVKGVDRFVFISGINLTLLDPTSIYFFDSNGVRYNAISFYNVSGSEVLTYWNIPITAVNGLYSLNITNGAVVQGISNGVIEIVDSVTTAEFSLENSVVRTFNDLTPNLRYNFSTNDFTIAKRINASLPTTPIDVNNRVIDNVGSITVKGPNVLNGALTSSWNIVFTIRNTNSNNNYSSSIPFLGITETSNAEFTSLSSLIKNYSLYESTYPGLTFGPSSLDMSNATYRKVILRKTGNEILWLGFANPDNNIVSVLHKQTIDTSKVYALFFSQFNNHVADSNSSNRIQIQSFEIKN